MDTVAASMYWKIHWYVSLNNGHPGKCVTDMASHQLMATH